MSTYTPKPIETNVELPSEVEDLIERLAENTHENWSKQRIEEGWTYGPKRDVVAKTNPCLVPYDQLSDSEKEYDRTTSHETLKTIIALGFCIDQSQPVSG